MSDTTGRRTFLQSSAATGLLILKPGTVFGSAANYAKCHLTFLTDFQTRVRPVFNEAAERVRRGDIGSPVLGHVYYHANRLAPQTKAGASADENRLRNWVFDKAISGDIIVEQNV